MKSGTLGNRKKYWKSYPLWYLRKEMHPNVYIGITYLNRIAGLEISGIFHEWMFTYIQSLRQNKGAYDWAQFISDSIHHAIEETLGNFYMSSYIVYACAVKAKIQGLNIVGIIGTKVGKNPIHAYFPQLEKKESVLHYKEVNDYFIMKLAQELEGRLGERLPEEVRKLIQCYGGWYIQFPTWSYLQNEDFQEGPSSCQDTFSLGMVNRFCR